MANTPYTTTSGAGTGRFVTLAFPFLNASISAADIVVDYTVPFPFKLVEIKSICTAAVTTGSKAATITPKIDGTAVTGCSLAMTSANQTPIGAVLSSTATDVTAGGNNIAYTAGSKLKLTGSSVTAFVEGSTVFHVTLQNLDA